MSNAQLVDVGLQGSALRYGDLCVHGVLDLRRSFTRDELERAVRATVLDFPVLGCIYQKHFFRDQWVPVQAPLSDMVHIGTGTNLAEETSTWTDRWLDPNQERPFRVVLLPKPDGCRLIVSVSHWAADGSGMAAAGHVFAAHLYGVAPVFPVEPRRDLRRALNGLGLRHVPVFMRDLASSLLQPWRVWSAGPRNRPYAADDSGNTSSKQVIIEKSTLEAIEKRCGRHVRVNDLLVAVVSMVAAKRSSYGPVPVMYTMDLRRFSPAPHLSVTNASSILTTIVPREATRDIVEALEEVEKATKAHRNSMAGPAFLLLPMLLTGPAPHGVVRSLLPALHPLLVDLPVSRGLIFTNVGKLDHNLGPMGDDIVDFRIVGPNIKGIAAPAIIAYGLRGRIHLELFAPPGLARQALDELEGELLDVLHA